MLVMSGIFTSVLVGDAARAAGPMKVLFVRLLCCKFDSFHLMYSFTSDTARAHYTINHLLIVSNAIIDMLFSI